MRSTLKHGANLALMAFLCGAMLSAGAQAQTTLPATAPATLPAEAAISPAASALLAEMRQAYSKLNTLDLAGTLSLDFDAAGQKQKEQASFTGLFQAPGKFRHEMKDDLLLVSDGEKAFAYKIDQKKYLTLEAPKGRTQVERMPPAIGMQLQQQNPSLLLALSADAAADLSQGVTTLDRGPDVTIDGTSYPSLALSAPGQSVQMLVHPQTHLMRQISIDLSEQLKNQGVPEVNTAKVTIDYSKSQPDAQLAGAGFTWTPPADAELVKPGAPQAGEEAGGQAAQELVGKPAPDFTLTNLNGENVALASTRGAVVVLDFWATWCPPCREGLPHLEKLHQEMASQGVKVFAVNVREADDVVRKFLDENKLTMPVLLDKQGAAGEQFHVEGIPQTVVIGKDGVVKNVIVGFGPGGETRLRQAVEAALKE